MRSFIASLAALSITCGLAASALSNEPPATMSSLEPLEAAKLDGVRGGFGIFRDIPLSALIISGGASQRSFPQQGRLILDADLNTVFGKVVGFGDGIRGRIPGGGMTQIDPPSLQLDAGTLEAWGRAGLRSSYRETDFNFVRRVADRLRHRDR